MMQLIQDACSVLDGDRLLFAGDSYQSVSQR